MKTLLSLTMVGLLVVAAPAADAADRPAHVITPSGSPVELDPSRATLFDTPALWVGVRNTYSRPVHYALRVWVFDPSMRLKGTADYCTGDLLDRAMRGRINFPLEIRGVTVRDRAVVTVIRARSESMAWIVRESEADQLLAARAAAHGSSPRLTLDRESSPGEWNCPCDCHEIETTCGRLCDRQLSAFTCAPVLNVCSATCTCK